MDFITVLDPIPVTSLEQRTRVCWELLVTLTCRSPKVPCLVLGCFFTWKNPFQRDTQPDQAGGVCCCCDENQSGNGVFEENRLRRDAFNKLCLQGALLSLSQTLSASR